MENLPNIWIHKEIIFILEKRDFENEVEYCPKEKLDIAVAALNEIAAWHENKEKVDSTFDEPWSARFARKAIKELGE